jgi:hypothetical protein
MDEKTKVAVVVLVAAILISAMGSLAIAFACGYVAATIVNSPQFDKAVIQQKFAQLVQAIKGG